MFAEYLATSLAFARAFSKATARYAPGGLDVERFKNSKEIFREYEKKAECCQKVSSTLAVWLRPIATVVSGLWNTAMQAHYRGSI
jgi:hypothetical protein